MVRARLFTLRRLTIRIPHDYRQDHGPSPTCPCSGRRASGIGERSRHVFPAVPLIFLVQSCYIMSLDSCDPT